MNYAWISNQIDLLNMQYGGMFLDEARSWLHSLAVIVLVWIGIKAMLASGKSNPQAAGDVMETFMRFVITFLIAESILDYWNVALPWSTLTIPELLPHTANDLVQFIDDTSVEQVMGKFKAAIDGLNATTFPSFSLTSAFDLGLLFWSAIVYGISIVCMWIMEAVMAGINIAGYLAIGIGTCLGPLMVVFIIVPGQMSQLFWKLVWYMVEFSMWRVVAALVAFVWANAWAAFWDMGMRGDYSIGQFGAMMPYMITFSLGTLWSIFYIPRYTSDLFKGTATGGSNFASGLALVVRAIA